MTTKITFDFETRSHVSLPKVGAWLYSIDPSTEPIILSWSDGFMEEGQWNLGDPPPAELFHLIGGNGAVVEAHSSFFEWAIWHNICVPRYKWPAIEWHRWRCTLSKAAACSLPKGLGAAGKILNLRIVKDEAEGKWAMLKMSRPKKDGTWHEDDVDRAKTAAYNMTDVLSEEHLSAALPDLPPAELEVWRMTEEINRRGIMIDVAGCRKAVMMAGEYARKLTDEFSSLTGLETAGQRAKFIVWLAGRGHQIGNTQADTLDKFIATAALDRDAARAASIVTEIGRSSIKKYRACLEMAAPDGRARGTFSYHSAHTGRWSGRGLQPQNFKRECRWNMDQAWKDVHAFDLETIEMIYGNPLQFLAEITRGALVAAPGHVLMAGDWAQIEPRVLFWQAGEQKGLASFRRGEDVYLEMAMLIFNRKLTKADSEERFLGKHAILALGYGAGYIKFLLHCRDLGAPRFGMDRVRSLVPAGWLNATMKWIWRENWKEVLKKMPDATREDVCDLALCKFIVDKYRKQYKKTVVKYWYDVEDAARRAIQNPGVTYRVGPVAYTCGKQFLNCRLPSGRIMRYFDPKLSPHGEISYVTPEEYRKSTYGGSMVENLTQAISRDIMAERMLALRDTPEYGQIVMTVHDEVISEVRQDVGSLEEFLGILSQVPSWCPGVPIKVEGFISQRYKKG